MRFNKRFDQAKSALLILIYYVLASLATWTTWSRKVLYVLCIHCHTCIWYPTPKLFETPPHHCTTATATANLQKRHPSTSIPRISVKVRMVSRLFFPYQIIPLISPLEGGNTVHTPKWPGVFGGTFGWKGWEIFQLIELSKAKKPQLSNIGSTKKDDTYIYNIIWF